MNAKDIELARFIRDCAILTPGVFELGKATDAIAAHTAEAALEERSRMGRFIARVVGGYVEGLPTSGINYLQRLRAMLEAEKDAAEALADYKRAVDELVKTARAAGEYWNHDQDSKVGKYLGAMCGNRGILPDLDKALAAIAELKKDNG